MHSILWHIMHRCNYISIANIYFLIYISFIYFCQKLKQISLMWYHLYDYKLARIFLSNAKIADVWYHRPLNERCKHSSIGRPTMPLKRPLVVARSNGCLHLAGSTTDPTKTRPSVYFEFLQNFIHRKKMMEIFHSCVTDVRKFTWYMKNMMARFKERWASVKLRPRGPFQPTTAISAVLLSPAIIWLLRTWLYLQ